MSAISELRLCYTTAVRTREHGTLLSGIVVSCSLPRALDAYALQDLLPENIVERLIGGSSGQFSCGNIALRLAHRLKDSSDRLSM